MKHFLTTLICILSCSVALMAKSKAPQFFKEDAKAVLNIDFSKTTWEEDENFKAWCGDTYDERVEASNTYFKKGFNEHSEGLKIVDSADDAKYEINITVNNFERKIAGWGWGRAHIKIYGKIQVVNKTTGETVYTFNINGISGGDDYVETDRFKKSFAELAEEFLK